MSVPARKMILGLVLVVSLGFAVAPAQAAPSGGCIPVGMTATACTFIYTGAPEAWVVPAGVTSAVFDVSGAQGGTFTPAGASPGGSGGLGADVHATVSLTPGATLNMRVGGKGGDDLNTGNASGTFTVAGGFNGGGTNTATCPSSCSGFLGAAGGGSSDVRTSGDLLTDRLLVAGGGGGAGIGATPVAGADPGNGGNSATTAKSVTSQSTCSGGGSGTLVGPGSAGSGCGASGSSGDASGLTGGGNNGHFWLGAGGGGYFGGGAGAQGVDITSGFFASGGGGGSDYPNPLSPPAGITNLTVVDGARSGNGVITLTYTNPSAVTFASASATRTTTGVLVRWRTGTEADLIGFQVYRSRGHSWQRLTHSLIAAKGSVSGASYRFLDRPARRGIGYRYRIRAVNRDGTTAWFGPVRVT